ncbi:MAG: MmcQ/YjbR family DNA-binding protein [Campylobacter sp.]
MKEIVGNFIFEKFGVSGEKVFSNFSEHELFRIKDGEKWFALMMKIERKKLFLSKKFDTKFDAKNSEKKRSQNIKFDEISSEIYAKHSRAGFLEYEPKFEQVPIQNEPNLKERIWILNLKCDPNLAPILHDFRAIFPAYHMNKRHWISVDLNANDVLNLDKNSREILDKNLLFELIVQSYSLVKNGKI